MSNHETYREWLALAAAGALEEHEERELHAHAASCAECAAALQPLQAVAGALARIPTPQPRHEVVQRTIARAAGELAEAADRRLRRNALVLVMVTAWLATLASAAMLKSVLVWMGATVGLGTALVVMTAVGGSIAVAVFCADHAKTVMLRRQE